MIQRAYDAILLDLDGTLVDDSGRVPAGTLAALRSASASGVRVVVATGRSELGAIEVLDQLDIGEVAVVYNGAGLYCPRQGRLIEERILSNGIVRRALDFAERDELLTIAMRGGAKFASPPRNEVEEAALRGLEGLTVVEGPLPAEHLIRLTFFDETDHLDLERRLREVVDTPAYFTSFPLSMLVVHKESKLSVVDLHPPCRGKGESLRVLQEHYGIPPERTVAVGDAMNDIPMLEDAGLAVAMEGSTPGVLAAADRVIGSNNSDAIGELVRELFG